MIEYIAEYNLEVALYANELEMVSKYRKAIECTDSPVKWTDYYWSFDVLMKIVKDTDLIMRISYTNL